MKEEIFKEIIQGENITNLKNEVCDALKKMDNAEFLHLFFALCSLSRLDDECDCDDCCCDECDCDDCDCDECDCDCDCK